MLKLIQILILAAPLTGCVATLSYPSHITPETKWLEIGHGLLVAADASQTIQGQNAPDCYKETGSIAQPIIGTHPSDSAILGYSAARFALQFAVADWLDRMIDATDDDGWRWARTGWQIVTFAQDIKTVVDNRHEGLGIFSPGAIPQRCLDARARSNSLAK